ncbi:homocysteine-responsive endoplasmic reticulum-resident ubiquitin-like domain member 1 protein [Brachionichthys hirsutus]|uniref:homocysteine-responsive endoplasmic reticulum-resident ubiquitin-like domain member 1 protein n=1 Tax=Brachionichthys hirsutus TaxID=412623 RepID=UPI003604F3A8
MDAGDSEQKTISLVFKTPSQTHEDRKVDGVQLGWTVQELKTHLSNVHPGRPAVCDQRLIYAGKLLPDHLHIRDVFRQLDSVPTVHLVCAFGNQSQDQLGTRPKTTETEKPRPSSSSSAVQDPSTPELRQRRQTSSAAAPPHAHNSVSPPETPSWTAAAAMPGVPQMTQPAFPTYSLYSAQQLMWLQQVYARQYYMQYQAALAAAGNVPSAPAATIGRYPPVPAHQVAVPAPLANQNPINNLPANQNPGQDAAFINPGEANQNLRLNAQGGPVMADEEDVDRDWLDKLYSATRLGVLLMIMYFNSNLSRFLLVMSTLLFLYLQTAGWFPFRRRVQVEVPNFRQPPEVQENQQNENRDPLPVRKHHDELADRQRQEPVGAANESNAQEPMAAVLVPPHRVSVMWTAWVFFKTLFSSLIPEIPQGMAN